MPSWKKPATSPQKIGILLFDQFSNHCLANAVEPLRAANMLLRRRVYDWQFLSLDGAPVTSSSGLQIAPLGRFGQEGAGDMLFLLPSYDYLSHATPNTARALRAAARRYPVLAGFDTGTWLLADADLLDGRQVTIHWEELAAFEEQFPEADAIRARYVMDENRLSSSGAMAAFDLVLALIARRHGEALAHDVATLFMQQAQSQSRAPRHQRYSRPVAQALAKIQENLEEPLPIPELARLSGQGQKAMEQRFQAELAATPQQVYKRERLILARKLAEETALSVVEIALRCGYNDPAAMSRAFRLEFGHSPSAARQLAARAGQVGQ